MNKAFRPRRDFKGLEARRKQAARLFAAGRLSQAEIARRLGVSRTSVHRWHAAWQRGGTPALRRVGRAGRKPRLETTDLQALDQALRQGAVASGFSTDLWTLPRVARVIKELTGVEYHPGHVWRILRSLDWTRQRPVRRAKERDEKAIQRWVAKDWPRVKKRLPEAGLDRLRRRKRCLRPTADPNDLGAERPDPRRDAPLPLEEGVGGGGFGVPLGRPALQADLPDQARQLQHGGPHPFSAAAPEPLPRQEGHLDLGPPQRAQERGDGVLPGPSAPVVAGGMAPGVRPPTLTRSRCCGATSRDRRSRTSRSRTLWMWSTACVWVWAGPDAETWVSPSSGTRGFRLPRVLLYYTRLNNLLQPPLRHKNTHGSRRGVGRVHRRIAL